MNRLAAGGLVALAAGATGVAIWSGANVSVAAPAAGTAVVAAGLLFVVALLDRAAVITAPSARDSPRDEYLFRFGFRSGRLGREEILATLDRIERSGPNPHLPGRTSKQIASIVELPRPEFRDYVRRRVDELEARS